ncbi:MAG: glycine dehydrogenase (aminomethyl-transferring), partial [Acidimicrobiia bacterium]|nr:glycine dehydrogenase (aminomethyl-transferring) [Acidimicrobiia bacterium]
MTFVDRHIGPRDAELDEMLALLGVGSLAELIDKAVPAGIRTDQLELPEPMSETRALEALRVIADQNTPMRSLIGQGYYGTITPGVILRNVLESPGWYTSYTPYQPEISQGRLEALTVFQTMVSDLTGMDLANASLLDEATAAAEAMALSHRVTKLDSDVFFVDADTLPQTISVVRTRAESLGLDVVVGPWATALEHQPFG